eukprot:TRINITY_DN4621_c0_g4_i2.p1 TRINITY_DN4621_c0_g4~~TRINITY_DN4621_c0_g4_i2.p1  ORF type:complete len:110 (-),score=38.69 TRINITY_DN4621_c0_g4_i2:120-449(-)
MVSKQQMSAAEQEALKQKQMAEARESMLKQIMTQEAKERLDKIALVKPEKAQAIGGSIIADAQMGRITGKLTDTQLIQKIESYEANASKTTLKISHKRADSDDIDLSGI